MMTHEWLDLMNDYILDWSANTFIESVMRLASIKHSGIDLATDLPAIIYVLDRIFSTTLYRIRAMFCYERSIGRLMTDSAKSGVLRLGRYYAKG